MLVSEMELQLSDDHEGIIDLPEDAPVGQPYAAYAGLDDPVIEINLTPNRPDCTSVHGIARDLAAAGLGKLKGDAVQPVKGAGACPVSVTLDFEAGDEHLCPAFALRLVRGVKNGAVAGVDAAAPRRDRAAPDQRARRHHQLRHLRPRPAAARLRRRQGQGRPHRPPRARTAKRSLALDGRTYTLDDSIVVIADADGVGVDRRHHGRRALGLRRDDDRRADRIGAVGPAQHRAIGPPARHPAPMRATASSAASIRPSRCPASILRPSMVLELCGGEASERRRRGRDPRHRPHHRLPLDRGAAPLRPRCAAPGDRRSSSRASASTSRAPATA